MLGRFFSPRRDTTRASATTTPSFASTTSTRPTSCHTSFHRATSSVHFAGPGCRATENAMLQRWRRQHPARAVACYAGVPAVCGIVQDAQLCGESSPLQRPLCLYVDGDSESQPTTRWSSLFYGVRLFVSRSWHSRSDQCNSGLRTDLRRRSR